MLFASSGVALKPRALAGEGLVRNLDSGDSRVVRVSASSESQECSVHKSFDGDSLSLLVSVFREEPLLPAHRESLFLRLPSLSVCTSLCCLI